MSATQIIILVIVVVVVLAIIAAVVTASRRRALRNRFGPEYDRVVAERDSRTKAEQELRARERRHAELQLRPLSPERRAAFAADWADVQARFVDAPQDAVRAGDELVTRLVSEIGYPTENYDEQLETLSVEHARVLGHYRDAHDVQLANERGEATTEQLRQALVHYRALFADLLGEDPVPGELPGAPARPVSPGSTSPDGASPDDISPDSAFRDGVRREGAPRDGAARDGAARDGATAADVSAVENTAADAPVDESLDNEPTPRHADTTESARLREQTRAEDVTPRR